MEWRLTDREETMSKQCLFCGAVLDDDAIFCDECGKRQDDVSTKEIVSKKEQEETVAKEREQAETEMRIKAEQEAEAAREREQAEREMRIKAQNKKQKYIRKQ